MIYIASVKSDILRFTRENKKNTAKKNWLDDQSVNRNIKLSLINECFAWLKLN